MAGVTDLTKIPAFPPVAARLLRLLADDDLDTLSETIRADPSLAADLLRRAKSPLYGFGGRIDTLRHALAMLGFARVRKLAMTLVAGSYLQGATHREEFQRCRRHMLATALLTDELAWCCSMAEDRGYIAGLLHDIGRMGLLVAHLNEYVNLLNVAGENAYDVLECERNLFGLDHCEAGRLLAEQWNLPQELRVIAGRHHDAPAGNDVDLLYLTQLGCRLADTLGFWAVRPACESTVEEILSALPAEARSRFCPDLGQLRSALEAEIAAYAGETTEPAAAPVPPEALLRTIPTHAPLPDEPGGISSALVALIFALLGMIVTLLVISR